MQSTYAKTTDGTITLNITIPWEMIKKAREEVVQDTVKSTDLPGFRKGKAPKKLVEEKLDESKVKEEILKKLLPKAYVDAVQTHKLKPIINPHIHVSKIDDPTIASGQVDWEFTAVTCESPIVELSDYKKSVQKVTAKAKIIIPGKEKDLPAGPLRREASRQGEPKFDETIKALLESSTVTIPKILVDQEVEKLLAQMLDEVKRLGLTLDQYLTATKKTPETLRVEYTGKAEGDIKIEFILQKIAEVEKITISEQEIDEAIQKAKDEKERKNLEDNRYLLASILRQQKTLDFIKNL